MEIISKTTENKYFWQVNALKTPQHMGNENFSTTVFHVCGVAGGFTDAKELKLNALDEHAIQFSPQERENYWSFLGSNLVLYVHKAQTIL